MIDELYTMLVIQTVILGLICLFVLLIGASIRSGLGEHLKRIQQSVDRHSEIPDALDKVNKELVNLRKALEAQQIAQRQAEINEAGRRMKSQG